MSSEFRSIKEQQYLIEGYCKQKYPKSIPLMLIQLILSFYNDIFYWKFKNDTLKKFLSARRDECIFSKSFKIQHIKFKCLVYPKGRKNSVECGICIESMDDNIKYVVVICKFYNKEFDVFRVNTIKETKQPDYGAGNTLLMLSEKCQTLNELNIYCKLEIIRIEPNDLSKYESLFYHKPGIKMSKNVYFEWKFEQDLLTKIKSESNDYSTFRLYCSPYFDDNNWIIKFFRNMGVNSKYEIRFQLFKLPKNVKQIQFKYTFEFKRNDIMILRIISKRTRNYDGMDLATGKRVNMSDDDIMNTTSLMASVHIEIQNVTDFNDKQIDQKEWANYGIV